jgi:hypothetical protein
LFISQISFPLCDRFMNLPLNVVNASTDSGLVCRSAICDFVLNQTNLILPSLTMLLT